MQTSELAAARAAVLETFTSVAAVLRGGVPVASYRCRLIQRTVRKKAEGVEGGRFVSISVWRALLPHTADVRATDRLEIRGEPFEVTATSAPSSDALELAADLRRVK